ncbi:FG-GAP-like repeat-containing protein [Lysobacter sp. A6]|uniref:FG-GAP-like repeat-containing protein n=1 Tax=Noviluteimonas lactosilytica TaxID=2888523 RepID=A0ABS8JE05_9GAMM|nr:SpvB/TcaC N-terminal domain-containing protein [Lysobacter lactosilyticus]MCC8361834.1 FG-GAP-like repeat-containing protein [Lysobacter lactosilyticus]
MSNASSSRAPLGAAGFLVLAATFLGLPALGLVYALTFGGPTIKTADTVSDTVGATAAQFRVDESGAATYSIPIYTVPGRAGVAPSLTLSYSSQGGEGPMGKGWSIGGLSSITRCRSTREAGDFIVGGVATDGVAEPVDFSASDRFCLDGQRLVPAADACGAAGGYTGISYRTEVDSFSRVCAWGPTAQDPKFFTVARRDGSTTWYGDRDVAASAGPVSTNGFFANTAPGALIWAQTRMQDSAGNTIDYKWNKNPSGAENGELLISEVQFTGKVPRVGTTGTTQAPFAKVVFTYSARLAVDWTLGFASGTMMRQTRTLTSVKSCADFACAMPARYYELTYGRTVNGVKVGLEDTGSLLLTSVRECRDANTSCLAPTTFTWSTAKNELATSDGWVPSLFGSLLKFEGFKLGDVDGDGRPDLVWLKDGSTGETCPTEHIMVSFGTFDGTQQTFRTPVLAGCTPTELMSSLGGDSWQLFDYNGDGRDDFFAAGALGQNYFLYASQGDVADPFGNTNLLASVPIPVTYVAGAYTNPTHPLLTDFNGDGLLDVMYKLADNTYRVRLMTRSGATWVWGAERTISFTTEQPLVCPAEAVAGTCAYSAGVPVMPDKTRLVDFDGDAASDIIFEKSVTYDDGTVYCPPPNPRDPDQESCSRRTGVVYTLPGRVKSITATNIQFTNIGDDPLLYKNTILQGGGTNSRNLLFGDINGDGLTDLVYVRANESPDGMFVYALNTGRGFLPYVDIGTLPKSDIARLVDVNGDGRSDLVYVEWQAMTNPWRWRQRPALRAGGFGPSAQIPGNQAIACLGDPCDPKQYATMFNDLDGDGALDYFTISFGTSSPNFVRSQSAATAVGKPRDVITSVVNGLGSRTDLQYAALTNGKVHVRRATSRDAFNSGRGAPTLDFIAPSYVVAKASSSAPVDGDPNAMASVYYRYAGARIQAGGRGFLGFEQVYSFDPNHMSGGVATQTNYEQRFPYTGMPVSTRKSRFSTFAVEACLNDPKQDACFAEPGAALPAFTATTFSLNTQVYESDTESAATTITAFVPGTQKPVHVRTNSTSERLYDPTTGAASSRVETDFTYGANGNVATTQAETYTTWYSTETLTSTILTSNTYSDNNTYWWLGRLTGSVVTHRRSGVPDVVRNTAFTYDANTGGMLISERIQPGVVDQDLRKQKTFDVYGNVTASMTCANPSTGCDTSISFHPASANTIERYARTVYDAESRYPVATYEPFWNGTATVEKQTSVVASRDIFGNVTQATDVNGNISAAQFGALGRPYATWTETGDSGTPGTGGISTTVTYRWCGTGTNRVTCPDGAKYRVRSWSDAGPMSWSYFDALGREVMTVKETFNTALVNKELSAVCTAYEESGKPSRVTNPFFIAGALANIDSLGLAAVCLGKPSTQSVYDTLGRVVLTTGPDGSEVATYYNQMFTTITDARGNPRLELRNGKGELRYIKDAFDTQLDYFYNADGTLRSISRTASAARGAVINSWAYDALGRKIWQSDPDSGVTNFAYNPAGELVAQWDAAGNRIDYDIDARGRAWRKTVKRADGVVESQSTTVFDTAAGGVGKVASEEIIGQYMDLVGQAGTEVDFQRTFGYDVMGRPLSSTTTIDGVAYSTAVAYDAKSRPFRAQDVSGRWTKTEFNSRGFAAAICESSAGDNLAACSTSWQRTQETDAFGHSLRETRAPGGPMTITRTYDSLTGRLEQLCANKGTAVCDLMNEAYGWDGNGNLHTLVKEGRTMETFTYDELDRLLEAKFAATGVVSQSFVYDKLGNICQKKEWNQTIFYTYGGRAGCGADGLPGGGSTSVFGPHQLVGYNTTTYITYDDHGNQLTKIRSDVPTSWLNRGVKYTLDDKGYEITLGDINGSPSQRTRFWYGPDGNRYKREDGSKRTLYFGNVEVIINGGITTYRRYVGDVVQDVVGGVASTRYAFKDQLGSIVRIVDGNGVVVQKRDFDAFGEKRNPDDALLQGDVYSPEYTTRGFTGHESIDGAYRTFAVHMGGRLYDSLVGRFMQADPVIQSPGNMQSWNAYTYVFNNPLTYTDPTGMWGVKEQNALRQVAALVISVWTGGAAAGWWTIGGLSGASAAAIAVAGGFAAGAISSGTMKGGILGAFTAMASFGVGVAAADLGGAARIALQALSGGVVESLQGGNFGHAFAAAGLTAAFMPHVGGGTRVANATLGALIGGAISEATGGKFVNGAISGAIQGAMSSGANQDSDIVVTGAGVRGRKIVGDINKPIFYDENGKPLNEFTSLEAALAAGEQAATLAKEQSGTVYEYGVATIQGKPTADGESTWYNSMVVTSRNRSRINWDFGAVDGLVAINHSHPDTGGFSTQDKTTYDNLRKRFPKTFIGVYMFDGKGNHWYGPDKIPGFRSQRDHMCGVNWEGCGALGEGWTP